MTQAAKPRIAEVIIVEGRYDKNTLSQVVDATILETSGFGIFNDAQRLELFRRMARERGLILLTDPDGAGFVIRGHLKGAIPPSQLKQAYIPDCPGKEKRKRAPGKEGKLGVEGMPPQVLLDALRRAGATFLDESQAGQKQGRAVTPADLYAAGYSGTPDAAQRRRTLLQKLDLPQRLSTPALLDVLNVLYRYETLQEMGVF